MAEKRPGGRVRVDWEAVEREFRTGKFTNVELADRFKLDPATLSRKIKADRARDDSRWQKDLSEVVRQATNAMLMADLVKSEVKEGQDQVNLTVKAAAEVGAQVIRQHRAKLAEVTAGADRARAKVLELLEGVSDIREAATAMGAIESWARITKTVVEKERQAFGLEDVAPANPLEAMSEAELEAEAERLKKARGQ